MNKETIDRFFRNECSPEEERNVSEYILNSQDEVHTQSLLKKAWNEPQFNDGSDNTKSRLFDKLKSGIESSDAARLKFNTRVVNHVSKKRLSKKFLGIAASIILTIGLSFTMYYLDEKDDQTIIQQMAEIERINSSGQRSRVILRDGTKVFLNAESRIRYSDQAYGLSSRNIFLEGEAYFEVAKNGNLPFIVTTKSLSTTALGTSFNVRAFNDETSSQISLVEGKVSVARLNEDMSQAKPFLLLPEEEIYLNEVKMVKRKFDKQQVVSWKDGIIYFNETDFNEATRVLERWYNVEFDIKNLKKGTGLKGTGTFKNESLENILKALSYSLDFEFKIDNDIVTINF
ncbi:MAG: transmembrane sensor [Cyclobacteriaceae bacterium]|jgi:transmembrane sensor